MSRSTTSCTLVLASVAALLGGVRPGAAYVSSFLHDARASGQDAQAPQPAACVELPAALRDGLATIATLRTAGEVAAAREALASLVGGAAWAELLEQELDVVLAGLAALDDEAHRLDMLEQERSVREERVARLAAQREPDDSERLAAEHALGVTRYRLNDVRGAYELLRRVQKARARTFPPDHADRLAVEHDLAKAHYRRGNLRAARKLLEHVHEARARLLPADHADLLETESVMAVVRWRGGDLPGAYALFEGVVEARERLLPEDHPDRLTTRMIQALFLTALGERERAHELEEEVYAARRRLLPPDHPDLLKVAQNLASTRKALGDLRGARELEEEVYAVRKLRLEPDDPYRIGIAGNLALTRKALGDLHGALALEEEILEALCRTLPPGHPQLLDIELNRGVTLVQLGHVEEAREIFERVHEAYERRLPSGDPRLLNAMQNLAGVRALEGDVRGSLELLEAVLAARERTQPPDAPDLLGAKHHLAGLRRELGDLEGALELELEVYAARRRSLPDDHPDLLSVEQELSHVLLESGDLVAALELAERQYAAYTRTRPEGHRDRGGAATHLGMVRARIGDLAGALHLFEEAYADQPDDLSALQNLAAIHMLLRNSAEALELQERVLAARERTLPAHHPEVLRALVNLAQMHADLGADTRARELLERASADWEGPLPEEHSDLLRARSGLVHARFSTGDLSGALELAERVHATWSRLRPADDPEVLLSARQLAALRLYAGDPEGALAPARALLAGQLGRAAALRLEAPRVARAGAVAQLSHLWLPALLAELVEPATARELNERLFAVLESLRQASTSSTRVALALRRSPELRELYGRLAEVRGALADLRLTPPEEASALVDWSGSLVELASERDRLDRELRSTLAEQGLLVEQATCAGVARGLPPRSAFVGYHRYLRRFPVDPETARPPRPVDSLLAFVVTPDAKIRRIELGPCAVLEELVTRWRATLGRPTPRGVGVVAPEDDEESVGRALCAALLDPCLAALGAEPPATLHVVPDDFLHLLPLDALPWTDGRRVGEVLPIRLEVSTARLIAPPRCAPSSGTFLAIGGADYDAPDVAAPDLALAAAAPPTGPSPDRAGTPEHFEERVHMRQEVEALSAHYRDCFDREAVVLTGAHATKEALVELCSRARWLHVATHGWFAPETFTSMHGSVEEHGDLCGALSRAEDTVRGFAPETLCGLALAGANRGTNALGRVPGILTAEELATLDLTGCELAVLSACETNVGLRRAGQGVQSLQSALHAAGARTAVTSLWEVDDAAARLLMESFYTRLWKERLGKADALWQAKMALRAKHSLRDWAGWVLSGDPD